jgi:hypothetical protein
MVSAIRHPENVPGDFYTDGDCLHCGVPEAEAPALLASLTEDNHTTYFVRQPVTPAEVELACRAIEVCCMASLRYGGHDPKIIRRLGNNAMNCDNLLPGGSIQPRRNLASRWWKFRSVVSSRAYRLMSLFR